MVREWISSIFKDTRRADPGDVISDNSEDHIGGNVQHKLSVTTKVTCTDFFLTNTYYSILIFCVFIF